MPETETETKNLLILTVGTGTAGKYSNLAEGLRRTVELLHPRRFWLVPSLSEDSQIMADLVSEGFKNFAALSPEARYRAIADPDNLEVCRETLRAAIAAARKELRPSERLLINPTSGTKQMTAAATLAALDENIGDIVFTVGERADGVVKTGTERIMPFDASAYFRERDFKTASELFASGGFYAAARILEPHKTVLLHAQATALMCHHWQRFDYEKAAGHASRFDEQLRRAFAARARAVKEGKPDAGVLADILSWAKFAFDRQDYDESVRLSYKAIEYAAKCRLAEKFNLFPEASGFYEPEKVYALHCDFEAQFEAFARPKLVLGQQNLMIILETLGDEPGTSWLGNRKSTACARTRNENTHSIRPIGEAEAQAILARVSSAVNAIFTLPSLFIPGRLPAEAIHQ
ncbi:MAG: hypothetical protein C4519_18740 [Desulfobacteraceae bacterium]|nr:MAG: hypothetical protein C4519_18740 [Desulfobacteraceae bacterium]